MQDYTLIVIIIVKALCSLDELVSRKHNVAWNIQNHVGVQSI